MRKKLLVAYFSASGVTAAAAKKLAAAVDADLLEIKPEIPYTDADLDWTNKNSRSSLEMNNPASRPAIAAQAANMEQYDAVFVGFPIWWYTAPTIIHTFLESYDFSGKTIIPFATSGGSNLGKTNDRLKASCPGATVVAGRLLNGTLTEDGLKKWAVELNL